MKTRKEYDSIGKINVPVDKYWGASTQRSKKYFDIGEIKVKEILIKSIAIIKKSAAIVHKKEKQIDVRIANAIIKPPTKRKTKFCSGGSGFWRDTFPNISRIYRSVK